MITIQEYLNVHKDIDFYNLSMLILFNARNKGIIITRITKEMLLDKSDYTFIELHKEYIKK